MPSDELKPVTFRIGTHLIAGLQTVKERDGIPVSEQVRRALVVWLESKDVSTKKTAPRRVSPRRRA